jgi:hypothetical protein
LLCAAGTCTPADRATCCETDSTKCKNSAVVCGSTKYLDSANYGITAGMNGVSNCCVNKAKCSSYTCPSAGKKTKVQCGKLDMCGLLMCSGRRIHMLHGR